MPAGPPVRGRAGRPALIVGVGAMAPAALAAGRALAAEGRDVIVASPRWVIPVPSALTELALTAGRVVVAEDGLVDGGIGSQLRDAVDDALDVLTAGGGGDSRGAAPAPPPTTRIGVPRRFVRTCDRAALLEEFSMTAEGVAAAVRARR